MSWCHRSGRGVWTQFAEEGEGIDEPVERGHEHEDADEETQRVDGIAESAGNHGEGWVGAFAPAGEEHDEDVDEDAGLPDIEGPSAVEDPAVVTEELDHDEDDEAGDEAGHGEEGVTDEAVGELEVVEDAGKEEHPAGGNEDGPPGEEGDAPAAGVGMPVEGGVVEGDERNPKQEAAEADPLGWAVVADVGATEAEAEERFGGEDDPGDGEGCGARGLAACEAIRKKEEDGDDDEGGLELAGSGGAAGVGIDGRVDGGAGCDVDQERNDEEADEAGDLCDAGGDCGRWVQL